MFAKSKYRLYDGTQSLRLEEIMCLFKVLGLIVVSLVWSWPVSVSAESDAQEWEFSPNASVLISEVQTGSEDDALYEFVELYNATDEVIDLTEWRLEYKAATGTNWSNRISSNQSGEATYSIEPNSFFLIATEEFVDKNPGIDVELLLSGAGLADSGGHLRLIKPDQQQNGSWLIVDLLGWGGADSPLVEAALTLDRDQSLHRCFLEDGEIFNQEDNSLDFAISSQPRPKESYDCLEPENGDDTDDGDDDNGNNQEGDTDEEGLDEQPTTYCEGVILSELLPNPKGPRSQFPREEHAFIEIHNPTDESISLEGCGLQTLSVNSGSLSDIFWFDDELILGAREFMAFFEEESKISLPVGVSGKVYLLDQNYVELDELNLENLEEMNLDSSLYEESIPEGASWSLFMDDEFFWQWSYSPTPGESNIKQPSRPCPEGQFRHSETNRCRNIVEEEPLPDCGPGRERNPETNRCRNIESAARQLVPCGPHQERNPETNRCRNIETTSSLTPCGPNQERNPETNRCRNIVLPNEEVINDIEEVRAAYVAAPISWWYAATIFTLALVYGLWEWRRDIHHLLRKITKNR